MRFFQHPASVHMYTYKLCGKWNIQTLSLLQYLMEYARGILSPVLFSIIMDDLSISIKASLLIIDYNTLFNSPI